MGKNKVSTRTMKGQDTRFVLNEKTVLYYRLRPVRAAKDLLNMNLNWFQRIELRAAWWKPYVLWVFGRGVGKTYLLAVFSVLRGMLYSNTKIGALGPVKRQGDYIFREMLIIYNQSPCFRASLKKPISISPLQSIALFTNGSEIKNIPVGIEGRNVRGERFNILCLDEFAQFDESIVDLVIIPFLAVKKKGLQNKLIMSSSAFYRYCHLWERYKIFLKKILIDKNPDYHLGVYDYNDVLLDPDSDFEPDLNIIAQQRDKMTEDDFKMEYLSTFPRETNSYFSTKLIQETCTPRPPCEDLVEIEMSCYSQIKGKRINNNHDYILGVDIGKAPGQANFSLGVGRIEGKIVKLVNMFTINGGTYKQMVDLIRYCTINFNVIKIQMDKGGGGEALKEELSKPWYDQLEEKIHLPILDMDEDSTLGINGLRYLRLINFQGAKHSNLFTNLKSEMEHGRVLFNIDVRKDPDKEIEKAGYELLLTKRELMVITSKPRGSNLHFEVPNNFRMDRAVALTLIVDALIEERNPEWQEKIPEEMPVGMWV